MKKILIISLILLFVFGALFYFNRVKIKDVIFGIQKKELPQALSYQEVKNELDKPKIILEDVKTQEVINVSGELTIREDIDISPQNDTEIPPEFNLDIPFSSQAPFGIWDEEHKEACEETSVLMAASYLSGSPILSAASADKDILKIIEWQKNNFGFWKDTDAYKTAEILKKYYGLKNTEVKSVANIDDIKREVAKGNPVIIPAAGRELGNPYYTRPGPYYHMLVVKGYTKTKIITNDPGTKRGEDFAYDNDILFNAIHDWNNGDVINGKKLMIVVK